MDTYKKLLRKFYDETNFLYHSTAYEQRTVQEFADWLDKQESAPQGKNKTCDCPEVEGKKYHVVGCFVGYLEQEKDIGLLRK